MCHPAQRRDPWAVRRTLRAVRRTTNGTGWRGGQPLQRRRQRLMAAQLLLSSLRPVVTSEGGEARRDDARVPPRAGMPHDDRTTNGTGWRGGQPLQQRRQRLMAAQLPLSSLRPVVTSEGGEARRDDARVPPRAGMPHDDRTTKGTGWRGGQPLQRRRLTANARYSIVKPSASCLKSLEAASRWSGVVVMLSTHSVSSRSTNLVSV